MLSLVKSKDLWALALCLLVTFIAAAAGGLASSQAGEFYQALQRPAWAPPGWLFAPVWTVLYTLMAIAAWLVWRRVGWQRARLALALYGGQLLLNALWTWLYFVWRLGAVALAEIVVLWLLILLTGVAFWRHSRVAGALLLPYLAWVSFAGALTWSTWRLNPGLLS